MLAMTFSANNPCNVLPLTDAVDLTQPVADIFEPAGHLPLGGSNDSMGTRAAYPQFRDWCAFYYLGD